MAYNGLDGFVATSPVGSSGVATVGHSTLNDNGGHGLSILGAGAIFGNILANVMHRNTDGIHVNVADPGTMLVSMSGNTAFKNLNADLFSVCPSPIVVEILSDNTNHHSGSTASANCNVFPTSTF